MTNIKYSVKLFGSDGKDYLVSYDGLAEKVSQILKQHQTWEETLGWNSVTKSLREDVDNLREQFLEVYWIPKEKERILQIVTEQQKIPTRHLNRLAPSHSIGAIAWYRAFEELEDNKQIVGISQGRGKDRLWVLAEDEK